MAPPAELFISHSHVDHEVLLRLSDELTRHGVPHWYAERELLGAQQWHDEIGSALQRCDWFAIMLSPAAVTSRWVREELVYALRQSRFVGRILPLLCEPCDIDSLSWTLGNRQIISLTPDFRAGVRDLLRVRGIGYRG